MKTLYFIPTYMPVSHYYLFSEDGTVGYYVMRDNPVKLHSASPDDWEHIHISADYQPIRACVLRKQFPIVLKLPETE